uniref:ZnMc domain-containing protein n=1 Tax=Strongyloides venezuelensis TaxID=75913 RepID=A0A0K0FVG2_STRVS
MSKFYVSFFLLKLLLLLINNVAICDEDNHKSLDLLSYRTKRGIFKNSRYFLGKMPIKYNITSPINESNLNKALSLIEHDTCIKFKKEELIPETSQGFMYYVNLANFTFCGPQFPDKPQVVFLSKECNNNVGCHLRQTVLSIGLLRQFNRPDRDDFIKINLNNAYWYVYGGEILETTFSKDEMDLYNTSYDFGSITHLDPYEYSKNGKPVMESIIPEYNKMMGQNYKLSFNDAKLLNLALCNSSCKGKKLYCTNNGFQDSKKCHICRCPNGYTGKYCQYVKEYSKKCGKKKLIAGKSKQFLKKSGKISCNYLITSDKGTKISLTLISSNTTEISPCFQKMGLEIKYRSDKGTTGLCLCGGFKNIALTSDDNTVLIQYNGKNDNDQFKLSYKQI